MPSALLLVVLAVVAIFLVAGAFRYLRQVFGGQRRR
jgi:hypothetical protein